MPRRKRQFDKEWKADARFGNPLVGHFVGMIMWAGKKSTAEKIIYDAFDIINERTKKAGLNTFEQAIKNVAPLLQLKSRRVGGANYQVPVPVSGERRQVLAMRWIRDACRNRKGKSMANKLADEVMAEICSKDDAVSSREDACSLDASASPWEDSAIFPEDSASKFAFLARLAAISEIDFEIVPPRNAANPHISNVPTTIRPTVK
jgi:small subunit ribosomal protein S7